MSLKRISARTILGLSIEETWESLAGPFTIVFDNGEEIATNDKEAVYSRYFWEFHKMFPAMPLNREHYVHDIIRNSRFGQRTHKTMLERVLWDAIDFASMSRSPLEMVTYRYELAEVAADITNRTFNELSTELEEYITSFSILDFHEIFSDPELVAAYERSEANEESIQDIYSTIDNLLKRKESLKHNILGQLYRSSLVSDKQVMQCLGPVGYRTDINNHRYGYPVMRGFYQGIRSARDIMIESRSAAKALNMAKGQLQDTEYFSRKCQLMVMTVERIHHCDCGSTHTLEWNVRGKGVGRPSDLMTLEGKYYHLEGETELKRVKSTDEHLIGKKVFLRWVFGCNHNDPSGICSTCYGGLADQIPINTNIGHANVTHVTEINTQSVMSVKHEDNSSRIAGITLDSNYTAFLRMNKDGNKFLFSEDIKAAMKQGRVEVRIAIEDATNLSDITKVRSVNQLSENRLSEIQYIEIGVDKAFEEFRVYDGKRNAFLTYEFLEYMKEEGYRIDEETNHYVVNLHGWKNASPFLSLPMQQFNSSDHSKDIAAVLESTVEEMVARDRMMSPASVLVDLTTLMNSRAAINLAVVEITLLGAAIRSAETLEYTIPKPWTQSGLGVMKYTILFRSLSAFMAYEHHAVAIFSPESYRLSGRNRQDSPFDSIMMPREVFAANPHMLPGAMAQTFGAAHGTLAPIHMDPVLAALPAPKPLY